MSSLPKTNSSEPDRVKSLLIETITLLCRNGLSYNKQLKIEGVIGVTIDDSEITLIHLNEYLDFSSNSNCLAQSSCSSKNKSKNRPESMPSFVNKVEDMDNSFDEEINESYNITATSANAVVDLKHNVNADNNKEFIVESPSSLLNSRSPSDGDDNLHSIIVSKNSDQPSLSVSRSVNPKKSLDLSVGPSSMSADFVCSAKTEVMFDRCLDEGDIKSETIDITDEEDCEGLSKSVRGNFCHNVSTSGTNARMIGDLTQRQRTFTNHNRGNNGPGSSGGQGDTSSGKVLSSADDFLVSMNFDVSDFQSSLSSNHRQRDDNAWHAASGFNLSAADSEFDMGYQFLPKKRMVGTVDNRPYACPVEGCDRRFFHRNNVYRHRKQKHPLEAMFKT